MPSFPEKFSAASKSQIDAQLQFFGNLAVKAMDGAEKMIALNIDVSKAALARSSAAMERMLSAKTPTELMQCGASAQSGIDHLIDYGRQLFSLATGAHAQWMDSAKLPQTSAAIAALTPPKLPSAVAALFAPVAEVKPAAKPEVAAKPATVVKAKPAAKAKPAVKAAPVAAAKPVAKATAPTKPVTKADTVAAKPVVKAATVATKPVAKAATVAAKPAVKAAAVAPAKPAAKAKPAAPAKAASVKAVAVPAKEAVVAKPAPVVEPAPVAAKPVVATAPAVKASRLRASRRQRHVRPSPRQNRPNSLTCSPRTNCRSPAAAAQR